MFALEVAFWTPILLVVLLSFSPVGRAVAGVIDANVDFIRARAEALRASVGVKPHPRGGVGDADALRRILELETALKALETEMHQVREALVMAPPPVLPSESRTSSCEGGAR